MADIGIRGLIKKFGEVTAVDGVDLVVREGEFLTLLGPSGCGKTTTLRCVAGLETPDRGEIRIGDDLVMSVERGVFVPPDKRDVGMVFQSYALWPHMTVFGNVAYPLRMRRTRRKEIKGRVYETLQFVGLAHLVDRPVTHLSGGQQQRVALARAMVSQPRLMLFDEPLSNLDAKLRATMRSELRAMHARLGTTSVYVTHDQIEAMTLSDRVVVMDCGRVQQIGAPQEIYRRPRNHFVADFVGFENFLPADVIKVRTDRLLAQPLSGGPALWCGYTDGIAEGARVELAVRSGTVEFTRHASGEEENVLTGVVQRRIYLGEQLEYALDAGGVSLIARMADPAVAHGDSAAPQPGEQVHVRVPPQSIVCLGEPETHEVAAAEDASAARVAGMT